MRTLLFLNQKLNSDTQQSSLYGESPSRNGQGVTVTLYTPSKAISGENPSQDGQDSQEVALNTPKECTSSDPITVTKKKKDKAHFKTRNMRGEFEPLYILLFRK